MTQLRKSLATGVSVLALALMMDPSPAEAQCVPAAGAGVTATCSGVTIDQNAPDGYGSGDHNLTVNVLSGASVIGTSDGIYVGNNGNIVNDGTIIGNTSDGIDAESNLTVDNSGTISGLGLTGISASTMTNLTNRGTITGNGHGIFVGTIANVTNWGLITGNGDGIFVNTIGDLINRGMITGLDNAITVSNVTNLTNWGTIAGVHLAIGANNITSLANWGTVTGSVELGLGGNPFNNMGGGLLNAGPTYDLGAGSPLNNAGTFAPGGIGALQTTTFTGNFIQTGTGVLATDLLFGSLIADLTNVSGTSTLSGQVVPNILNPGFVQPGTQQVTILTSAGGVTNAGLSLGTPDTAVVDYRLLFPDGLSVVLGVTVDFSPSGLNRNQRSVAEAISAIQAAGGSAGFAPVVAALVGIPDLAGLADAYDQLGPEIYLDNSIATLFSTLGFTDDLMSCEVREGGNVFIGEGQCLWAEVSGNWFDQDRTAS